MKKKHSEIVQEKRKPSDTLETPSKRIKLVEPENNDGSVADEKGNGEAD